MEKRDVKSRSALRKRMAEDIAAVLSGVMTVISVALPVKPGDLTVSEAVIGTLLVGFIAMMTRFLTDRTKKRTELGRGLRWDEVATLLEISAMVLLFPVLTAILLILGALDGLSWPARIDCIFYLGIATVFISGFMSAYIVETQLVAAGSQGLSWATLGVLLTIVKRFV